MQNLSTCKHPRHLDNILSFLATQEENLVFSRMVFIGIPLYVECGTTSNPCRCKVVGQTLGFLAFAVAAIIEWRVGAVVYCFRHGKGKSIMAHPSAIMAHPSAVVYPSVSSAIPLWLRKQRRKRTIVHQGRELRSGLMLRFRNYIAK